MGTKAFEWGQTMKMKLVMCGVAAVALAACEGTGDVTPNAFAFSDIDAGSAAFTALTSSATDAGNTTPTNLPGGSATYDGFMSVILEDDADDGVLGTMRMNVGFSGGSVTGTAGSFRNFRDQAVDGSLNISGNIVSGADVVGGQAQVSGSVELEAGTMAIEENYIHVFNGPTGEYNIGGVTDGMAQPAVGAPVGITSAWVLERQ